MGLHYHCVHRKIYCQAPQLEFELLKKTTIQILGLNINTCMSRSAFKQTLNYN